MKTDQTSGGLPIAVFLSAEREQKQDLGEDDGLYCVRSDPDAALLASLDGCGGAGAMRYAAADNWTGARIASRLCGQALQDWFLADYAAGLTGDALVLAMKGAIDAAFTQAKAALGGGSTLRSRMIRTLPTTLAAAVLEQGVDGVRCISVWAGDSRVYLMQPDGLVQLTKDDVSGELDAQENLERDGVLSNVISASGDYALHWRETTLRAPCIVLTATDGCFSYFHSPIEFEALLLETLLSSETPAMWEQTLTERIGRIASDDYTLELLALGFSSFEEVQNAYRPWAEAFHTRFGAPAAAAAASGDRARLGELWQAYKTSYMR